MDYNEGGLKLTDNLKYGVLRIKWSIKANVPKDSIQPFFSQ